jgi:hypothetical protein
MSSRLPSFAAISALALSACAQFQLVGTWQNPKVVAPRYSSVVVLTTLHETIPRQTFEDDFVNLAQAQGIRAIPGYSILNGAPDVTASEVEARVRGAGMQAAIVVNVIRTTVVIDTGPSYVTTGAPVWEVGYDGYYTTGSMAWEPNTYTESTQVQLRMNVYDATSKQLVWSAITNTVSQDQLSGGVYSIARMLFDGLYKRGILVAAGS